MAGASPSFQLRPPFRAPTCTAAFPAPSPRAGTNHRVGTSAPSPSWQPGYKDLNSPEAPQNGARNQALSFSVKKQTLKNTYIIEQDLLGLKAPTSAPLLTQPPTPDCPP